MGIGLAPKLNSLQLSSGQTFAHDIILGSETYPEGTTATIVIKDDAEIVLATWYGTISGVKATFIEDAPDSIPHGSKFDLFINYDDGTNLKHSYGRVVRNENRYPLNPTQITTNYALQFADNFDRTYVGKFWVPRNSSTSIGIHDNGANANTLGPNNSFWKDAGALWYTPLNTDSVTVTVSVVSVGNGQFTIAVCSDYSMSTWIGVQIEQNTFGQQYCRVVKGSSPTASGTVAGYTALGFGLGTPGNWTGYATGDTFTVKYNHQSRTISFYKNNGLTPVTSYTHSVGYIPVGAGYRYTGLVWNTALFTPGPEASQWSAKDGL
jgi:hypothetical protein